MPEEKVSKPESGAHPLVLDRELLFRLSFFAAFAWLLWQIWQIFSPFIPTLMAAATLVFVFQPAYRWILRRVRGRATIAALIGTLALLSVLIVPAVLMGWLLSREIATAIPTLQEWVRRIHEEGTPGALAVLPESVVDLVNRADAFVGSWGLDLNGLLVSGLSHVGDIVTSFGAGFVGNILLVALNVAVLAIGVFFFLRDGEVWLRAAVEIIPLQPRHKTLLLTRLDETLAAVIRGQLVTALVQGLLAGIGFGIAGLPHAVLLGFATCVSSLIPLVGAAGIWVPAAIYLFYVGPTWAAIFMLVWGIGVISLVDNILKPLLIGGKAKIPTFLLFFGILGGLELYGFLGIIVGPLLIGLMLTFVAIYREEMRAEA
jgi:predicted PurR-regulated permease PerM